MTISPFDLILLLGSGQGFILATLLWISPKGNRLSNRLLATLIGLLALMSFAVGIPVSNRWVVFALDFLPLIVAMPLGPLLYFHSKSLLNPAFRLGRAERAQFYPAILDIGSKVIGWVYLGGLWLGVFSKQDGPAWGSIMNEYDTYADIPRWLSMTIYLILTKQLLSQYLLADTTGKTETQSKDLRWLRQFINVLLGFQVLWLLHLVPYLMPASRNPLLDQVGWYPIYVPIAVMIYWLSFQGYLHARNNPVSVVTSRVSNTVISAETVDRAIHLLTSAMQTDRLYLDPELTVEKVSRHVQLPNKTVSFVINQHLQRSFNAFVNDYRIEAVKQQLTNPANEHLTLMGIALECGFNSQATFQRTFRQATGQSPKQYIEQQTAES